MTADMPATTDILAQRRGHLGILVLNRPQALNALSLDMIRALTVHLRAWLDDPEVGAVLLLGAGRPGRPPAFCAGGDIRFFHAAYHAGDPRMEDFFTEEYALDHLIHRYPKPTLVLMDGVTMGGGMGLGQGARLRVVTETSRLAMPETTIGLFPDVGGGWFLARCPGRMGEFLGLTGESLGAADAIGVGLADVRVPAQRLQALVDAVAAETRADGTGALEAARAHAVEAGDDTPVLAQRDLIDRAFAAPSVAAIIDILGQEASDFSHRIADDLAARSPLMLAVTLEQVRRGRTSTLADDLRMERGVMRHCLHLRPGASDAVEGIRALAIDKDRSPNWNPARLEDVEPALVQQFFASPWPAQAHPLRHLRD
ncbi:MAG TPA: enoyl-CoA hydratase/isomerase family protein [Burkholderiaceae bacterium]|nr:enoyl-CoA hydratase/isomerase family protein [Burkholderiaceae bacterium]